MLGPIQAVYSMCLLWQRLRKHVPPSPAQCLVMARGST